MSVSKVRTNAFVASRVRADASLRRGFQNASATPNIVPSIKPPLSSSARHDCVTCIFSFQLPKPEFVLGRKPSQLNESSACLGIAVFPPRTVQARARAIRDKSYLVGL